MFFPPLDNSFLEIFFANSLVASFQLISLIIIFFPVFGSTIQAIVSRESGLDIAIVPIGMLHPPPILLNISLSILILVLYYPYEFQQPKLLALVQVTSHQN